VRPLACTPSEFVLRASQLSIQIDAKRIEELHEVCSRGRTFGEVIEVGHEETLRAPSCRSVLLAE
jgi:hypothetical protein